MLLAGPCMQHVHACACSLIYNVYIYMQRMQAGIRPCIRILQMDHDNIAIAGIRKTACGRPAMQLICGFSYT